MESPKEKLIASVKVGERGQIVIPKDARELFGIRPGDTLLVLSDPKRGIAVLPCQFYEEMLQRGMEHLPLVQNKK